MGLPRPRDLVFHRRHEKRLSKLFGHFIKRHENAFAHNVLGKIFIYPKTYMMSDANDMSCNMVTKEPLLQSCGRSSE